MDIMDSRYPWWRRGLLFLEVRIIVALYLFLKGQIVYNNTMTI